MVKTSVPRGRKNVLKQLQLTDAQGREGIARSLWKQSRLLESRISDAYDARDLQTRSELFNSLLDHHELLTYIRDDLCVAGGTFGVADAESNEFILLQSAKYSRNPSIPVISIPFDLGSPQEGRERFLLEYMFLARRQSQKLDEMAPEFYNWLFRSADERETKGMLPPSTLEKKLLSTLDFSLGLCPSGEMLFCLYAWRWLVRFIQSHPEADPPFTPEWGFDACTGADLWQESVWRQAPDSPEYDWVLRVSQDRNTPGEVLDSWRTASDAFDIYPAECDRIVFEWGNLGLLQRNEENPGVLHLTRAFWALLALARKFRSVIADDKNRWVDFENLVQRGRGKSAVMPSVIQRLDRELRFLIHRYLVDLDEIGRTPRNIGRPGARTLLTLLHRHSRFPLMPYYYTTCIRRQPVEHLIFPVLKSAIEPLTVQTVRGKEKTDAVVFCILLLNPNWTSKALAALKGDGREITRSAREFCHASFIARIHYFFQIVSRPVIDLGYYGGIVRKRDRKSASLAEQEFFAHRFWAYVNNLGNSLTKNNLFTEMSPQARSSFVLLRAGIDRYRGKQHDDVSFILSMDAQEQVRQCILISAAWAYERAQVIPRATSTHAVSSARRVYSHLRSLSLSTADGTSAPERLLKSIVYRVAEIPSEAQSTVFSESFVVMLTSILGQAVYHTFRYKVLSGVDAADVDLSFTLDLDRHSLVVRVSNSGEQKSAEESRDRKEFSELGDYFGASNVLGPLYTEENRWCTGFSLPLRRPGAV